MRFSIVLLFCVSVSLAQYSYFDKCYRYYIPTSSSSQQYVYRQYYINRKGIPLSEDRIIHQCTPIDPDVVSVKYYYHEVLSNCTKTDNHYDCIGTLESIWLKIVNVTASTYYFDSCDSIFYEKYADITKNKCKKGSMDPFFFLYKSLGEVRKYRLEMSGNEPVLPEKLKAQPDGECIWEYDILGLVSIVVVVFMVVAFVLLLIVMIVVWIIVQKHRSNKRKRLDNSLIAHENV